MTRMYKRHAKPPNSPIEQLRLKVGEVILRWRSCPVYFVSAYQRVFYRMSPFPALLVVTLGFFVSGSRAQEPIRFNEQIRPLLNAHCVKCHGGVKEAGGMNLLFRDSALKGGKSGIP